MKRKGLMFLTIMFAAIITSNAQFRQRTVEERVASVHTKIDSAFKLDATKMANVDSIFANFYRSQDKLREDMMNGGDRLAMREKMRPMMEDRDNKLKAVLGDDNFKVWKEQIEPSMRPQRRGGGNNR
jgi:protein CpxP